jgi:hypothetical protein
MKPLKTPSRVMKPPAFKPAPGQPMQRAARDQSTRRQATMPGIVHEVLSSSGQPLSTSARGVMEPRFGHDFSQVQVHTDQRAAESARRVNALAYTIGQHIMFDAGKYDPSSQAGKHLLAHELTHVVQQAQAVQMKADISQPGDRHERQADQVAGAIDSASSFSISPSGEASLMRQTPPAAQEEDPNVKFLKDQVNKLTATKFENDYKKGFDFYDANKDGNIDKSELTQLLTDAEVGNTLTRWKWVDGVMNQMDTNKDGKITWTEFDSAIHK